MSKRERSDKEEEEEQEQESYLFWSDEQDRWFNLLLSEIRAFDPPISPERFTIRIQVMGDVCLEPNIAPRVKIALDLASDSDVTVKVTLCITHWKQLRLGFAKFCSKICKRLGHALNRGQSGGCEKSSLHHEAHASHASFFATFYQVRK